MRRAEHAKTWSRPQASEIQGSPYGITLGVARQLTATFDASGTSTSAARRHALQRRAAGRCQLGACESDGDVRGPDDRPIGEVCSEVENLDLATGALVHGLDLDLVACVSRVGGLVASYKIHIHTQVSDRRPHYVVEVQSFRGSVLLELSR
jgi:hypothetical protein